MSSREDLKATAETRLQDLFDDGAINAVDDIRAYVTSLEQERDELKKRLYQYEMPADAELITEEEIKQIFGADLDEEGFVGE